MYKYEMHVHSLEGSYCGASKARDIVKAYHKAGYAGLVLTDHFIHGNTRISRELPWEERMQQYYNIYLDAKEEGDHLDFDVLFGVEHHYANGKEVLIYGLDLEFYVSHPELRNGDIDLYNKLVHEAGGIMVHAHPYRQRSYIPEGIAPRFDVCDGIEVYNAADPDERNHMAYQAAIELCKPMLSGGDVHLAECKEVGLAGLAFPTRIRSNRKLVDAFLSRQGKIIKHGKVMN